MVSFGDRGCHNGAKYDQDMEQFFQVNWENINQQPQPEPACNGVYPTIPFAEINGSCRYGVEDQYITRANDPISDHIWIYEWLG